MIHGYRSNVLVAVPLGEAVEPVDHFYTKRDGEPKCKKGHSPEHDKQQFCPFDGHPFEKTVIYDPKPFFAEMAAKIGRAPDEFFGSFWKSDSKIRFYCLDAMRMASSVGTGSSGLGVKVQDMPFITSRAHGPVGVDIHAILAAKAEVEQVAATLGLTGEAQVYFPTRLDNY